MNNFLKTLTAVTIVAVTAISCSKSKENVIPVQRNDAKVLNYIRSLGFKDADVVDTGDRYLVEGDIYFPKNMEIPTGPTTEQNMRAGLVSATNKLDIKVFAHSTMSIAPSLLPGLNAAIAEWNSVPGSDLRFRIVTSMPYDILIKASYDGPSGLCSSGMFPNGGSAGILININKTLADMYSTDQRKGIILHELGHNIGFAHTGSGVGILVPGTPATDPLSVMNITPCGAGTTVLSPYDKIALAWAY